MMRFLTIWILVISSSSLFSQGLKTFPVFLEYSTSLNQARQLDESKHYGFGIGSNLHIQMGGVVSFFSGLEYNQSSFYRENISYGRFSSSENSHFRFNKISINIGFRFKFKSKHQPFIEFGFSPGYNVGTYVSQITTSYSPFNQSGPTISVEDGYRSPDLEGGVFIGVGMLVQLKKRQLLLRLDVKHGTRNYGGNYDAAALFNQFFRLSIGLRRKMPFEF